MSEDYPLSIIGIETKSLNELIEKAKKTDKLVAALEEIAREDYRGPKPRVISIVRNALYDYHEPIKVVYQEKNEPFVTVKMTQHNLKEPK